MRNMLLGGAIIALVLNDPVSARNLGGAVTDVSEMQDGRGSGRVLFRIQPDTPLDGMLVSRATVTFQATGVPAEKTLRLRVYSVTRAWTAGAVSWTAGWTTAGGDIDEELYMPVELDLRTATRTVELDLTPFVKESMEMGVFMDGFLLTADPEDADGIAATDLPRFVNLATGTLSVSCREKPSAGPRKR